METGLVKLQELIQQMEPVLDDEVYVFLTVESSDHIPVKDPICLFCEKEGITVICREIDLPNSVNSCSFRSRRITLNVHSSLEAVGFLSLITTALSKEGISCNAVSAYYHDHLFVPEKEAEKALKTLQQLI